MITEKESEMLTTIHRNGGDRAAMLIALVVQRDNLLDQRPVPEKHHLYVADLVTGALRDLEPQQFTRFVVGHTRKL